MTTPVERLAYRHMSQDVDKLSVTRLSGGISSEIYKITGTKKGGEQMDPQVLSVIRDKDNWWKIQKEENIRNLLGSDPEVLIPKLIETGVDKIENIDIAFMFSGLVAGRDLDDFLEVNIESTKETNKLAGLAHDLGYRLGLLHRHKSEITGLIGYQPECYDSWGKYVIGIFDKETRLISQADGSLKIGSVQMSDLQESLPPLQNLVGSLQEEIYNIPESKISHGDARFGNFMANISEDKSWKIASMIDLEAMLGGDPEIDVAFMENWLHFSSYKKEFFAEKRSFSEGYNKIQKVSSNYSKKRFVYHIIRSLAYLRTVFSFDIDSFLRTDLKNKRYVEQHMQIVQSLAKGNYLEDIGIQTLI